MYLWNEVIHNTIYYIEKNIAEVPSLSNIAKEFGYSPYYLSTKFHDITGMTLKDYIAKRRLTMATLEIRDTNTSLLKIAMKYGYASQQSLSRAFTRKYGITPSFYRKNPCSLPLLGKKEVLFPEYYENPNKNVTTLISNSVNIKIEYIPEHNFLGIIDLTTHNYESFCECHNIKYIHQISSMLKEFSHLCFQLPTSGYYYTNNLKGFFYGMVTIPDCDLQKYSNDKLKIHHIPGGYYMSFYHSTPDKMGYNNLIKSVDSFARIYKLDNKSMQWNSSNPFNYQRLSPHMLKYEILRPLNIY